MSERAEELQTVMVPIPARIYDILVQQARKDGIDSSTALRTAIMFWLNAAGGARYDEHGRKRD